LDLISDWPEFSLRGSADWLEIEADHCFFTIGRRSLGQSEKRRARVRCEATDLRVTHRSDSEEPKTTQIVFWLTPNKSLKPLSSYESSYLGNVQVKRAWTYDFPLGNRRIVFDQHYTSEVRGPRFVQWPQLVGVVETDAEPNDDPQSVAERLLPELDDLLLVISLASATRTACIGWNASNGKQDTNYYRRDIAVPNGESDHRLHAGLVHQEKFVRFVTHCAEKLRELPEKQAARNAMWALVALQAPTLEEGFRTVFAALEDIVLAFRRARGFEFTLDEVRWSHLRLELRATIKASSLKCSKHERSLLYTKLDEVNRVPLKFALEQFCLHYGVDLDDLWPVFGGQGGDGLYEIRNRLVHGGNIPLDSVDALMLASRHLHWTLARVLVARLGWYEHETSVSRYILERSAAITGVPAARNILRRAFHS
jgi:hypothetical protein